MKLELLLSAVALVPATLARTWGGRDDSVAALDVEDQLPVETRPPTTTTTITVEGDNVITVSTVVFVEHLFTTPGISNWENYTPDGYVSTSTTFTTTTVTHIPHIIYQTSDLTDAHHIALAKRSTVSITDWVTVTEGPDSPGVTSEGSASSETTTSTSTPLDAPQTPPPWATTATSSASPSAFTGTVPFNVSTSISETSPSSTSAVSGAPPISSPMGSETSSATSTSSSDTSSSKAFTRSTSLLVPPVPVTPTAPIPSDSMTIPAGPHSTSDLNTTSHRGHPLTLTTLTTGFKPPESSTATFIMASHDEPTLSSVEALATGKENVLPEEKGVPSQKQDIPTRETLAPTRDGPLDMGDEIVPSVTAPFTITLTTPAVTSPPTLTAPPATSTGVRCDNSWCSEDSTMYCMRWDGSSGVDSFGIVTPGEVFTTVGLCTPRTRPRTAHGPVQVSTLAGEPTASAISRHGPGK